MTYLIFGIIIMMIVTPILGLLLRDYPEDKRLKPYGEAELSDTVSSQSDGKQSTEGGIEYAHTIKMPVFYGLIVFAFLVLSGSIGLYALHIHRKNMRRQAA